METQIHIFIHRHKCSSHHVQQTAHPRDRRWTWFLFEVSPRHPDWRSVQHSQTAASMCCTKRASVEPMPVNFFPACLSEYFPFYRLLTFYLLALWSVCTAQPEGRGSVMLRSFKFYPWSPYTDTKPFLCEAASLTRTGVSIATSSYFYLRDKCPQLWFCFLMSLPLKGPKGPHPSPGKCPGDPNNLILSMSSGFWAHTKIRISILVVLSKYTK